MHCKDKVKMGGEIVEKDRGSKVIAVVALCIAVVGVTLGFAAFSNTLNIKPSANVTPTGDTFNVDFSSSDSAVETNPVTPVKNPTSLVAGNATINNSGSNPEISGLTATFTEPGQDVTYTFYVHNVGEYEAFLKSITYNNEATSSSFRKCTAGSGTTDALVQAACDDITVSVKVGSDAEVTATNSNITSHSLAKDANETVVVKIAYAAGGDRADGDFTVAFGDIALLYSTVD